MNPFPEDFELMEFFESEPNSKFIEKDVPWYYSQLDFLFKDGDELLQCIILPSYSELTLIFYTKTNLRYKSTYCGVSNLKIEKHKNHDNLIANIANFEGENNQILKIRLKPFIQIEQSYLNT